MFPFQQLPSPPYSNSSFPSPNSNPYYSTSQPSTFPSRPSQLPPSKTIFVGDLSIYSTEKDLFHAFATYGPIESIHLRRVPQGANSHLSYGFVRFKLRVSAETALTSMQGAIFLGHPLRIGWAEDTRNTNPQLQHRPGIPIPMIPTPGNAMVPPPMVQMVPPAAQPPHAQIHVTFVSNHLKIVTEAFLRNIFERFGHVLDVSIKKLHVNKENGQQSGYAFIHYALDDVGISSAMNAVNTMNENTVELIYFRCSASHGLTKFIQDRDHSRLMQNYKPHNSTSNLAKAEPSTFKKSTSGRISAYSSEMGPNTIEKSFIPSSVVSSGIRLSTYDQQQQYFESGGYPNSTYDQQSQYFESTNYPSSSPTTASFNNVVPSVSSSSSYTNGNEVDNSNSFHHTLPSHKRNIPDLEDVSNP